MLKINHLSEPLFSLWQVGDNPAPLVIDELAGEQRLEDMIVREPRLMRQVPHWAWLFDSAALRSAASVVSS